MKMLRVIFDTNIYGLLVLEKEEPWIRKKIKKDKDFIVMVLKKSGKN